MSKWFISYHGKPSKYSSTEVVQPSWNDFDKRIWKTSDNFHLELTRGFGAPKNKGNTYIVVLEHKGVELLSAKGTNWQLLVKLAKHYASQSGSGEKSDR